jgi:hypothetical protein
MNRTCPQCGVAHELRSFLEGPPVCPNCGSVDAVEYATWAKSEIERLKQQVANQKLSLTALQTDQAGAMHYLKGYYDDPNCPSMTLSVHNMFLKLREYEKTNEHTATRQTTGCAEKSGGTGEIKNT